MKQKLVLVAGGLVSILSLYWVFKDVNLRQIADAFRSFNILWLIPSLFFFYWSMYLRGVRWALFFRPHHVLTGSQLFRPIMIGFAFNSIMPARVGEFVRAFYVGQKEKTGVPTALATILTERIFDAVTLLASLGISFALLPPIDESLEVDFWGFKLKGTMLKPIIQEIVILCIILVVGVIVFMIPAVQRLAIRIVRTIPAIGGGLGNFVEGVARGLDSVKGIGNVSIIIFYSILMWGLIALSNMVLAYGFLGLQMNFLHAMATMSLVAVFIAIPAAPGYWGLFEAGVIFSLTVLGLKHDDSIAIAYAIIMHLVQFVPIVVIGLIFAAQSQVKLSKIDPHTH